MVEYLGTFPITASIHGNSKNGTSSEYVKITESVKSKIMEKIKTNQPRNVYCEIILENSIEAPRNLEQVQNAKYLTKKQQSSTENRKNTADDI